MDAEIKAQNSVGADVPIKATEYGVLYSAPIQMLWTAKGYGKQAMSTSAVASLIVRPSTTAMLTLYNGGAKHLVIERVFSHALVSIANCQFGIWLCSHPVGMTAPTGNNISVRNSTSGLDAGGSSGTVIDTAESVADNGWFPWGNSNTQVVATVPGGIVEAQIGGRIIVPPRAGLSLQIVANTAVVTNTNGFHWFEVPTSELVLS